MRFQCQAVISKLVFLFWWSTAVAETMFILSHHHLYDIHSAVSLLKGHCSLAMWIERWTRGTRQVTVGLMGANQTTPWGTGWCKTTGLMPLPQHLRSWTCSPKGFEEQVLSGCLSPIRIASGLSSVLEYSQALVRLDVLPLQLRKQMEAYSVWGKSDTLTDN